MMRREVVIDVLDVLFWFGALATTVPAAFGMLWLSAVGFVFMVTVGLVRSQLANKEYEQTRMKLREIISDYETEHGKLTQEEVDAFLSELRRHR